MTDQSRTIQLGEFGIGDIFKSKLLQVPRNQRDYAWKRDQITTLFEDFEEAIADEGPYFLGTIVTVARGDVLEVVDGQQRLATTAILIAAIRDHMRDIDDTEAVESINRDYLAVFKLTKRDRVHKMTLNVADNDLFIRIIDGIDVPTSAARQSHKRLLEARTIARKRVREIIAGLSPTAQPDRLVEWLEFIESRARVVLLQVPTDADAYRMFETLNDRGLRVSQADLVKNHLFARARDQRMGEVQHLWSSMTSTLEAATNDPDITIDFIRHCLITKYGYLREVDMFKTLQGKVRSATGVADFATTLDTLATVYVATFNPDHERWNAYGEPARKAVEVLHLFDIKPLRPVVMAVANGFGRAEMVPALDYLSVLAVRLIITTGTRSSVVELPLATAARKVTEGAIDTAGQLRSELDGIMPSDHRFRGAFQTAAVSSTKLAKYYLRSLQSTAEGTSGRAWWMPRDDMASINLEHVLPQKPEDNWPQFDEEAHEANVNRIGNLALMRAEDNSGLRSQPFDVKRPIYARAHYTLTSQIAEAGDWTPATIEVRQGTLAGLAVETWPIKRPTTPKPLKPKRHRTSRTEDFAEDALRIRSETTDG